MKIIAVAAVIAVLAPFTPCLGQDPTSQATPNSPPPTKKKSKDKEDEKHPGQFVDLYLGLQFMHPKTWVLRTKNRDLTRYTIPIAGTVDTADLEIRRATYHSPKDVWQGIQLRANETMHRAVVRQWEQTVIDVPMLCTQLAYTDKQTPVTALTGLYYTKTPLKMLVRLTAPAADYDKVKYEFDQSLQSLQTTNGTTPTEDDPNFKFEETKKPQLAPPRPDVITEDGPPPPKLIRGTVNVDVVVSTKPVKLRLPPGWSASVGSSGEVVLRNPHIPEPLTLSLRYALDSERPSLALIHATTPELDVYLPGLKREDTDATPNEEGCSVSTVWRMGKTASGDLFSFHASGESGDFYFIASFKTNSAREFKEDRIVIRALMDEIGLVAAGS